VVTVQSLLVELFECFRVDARPDVQQRSSNRGRSRRDQGSESVFVRAIVASELELELGSKPEGELSRRRDFLGGVFFRSGFLGSLIRLLYHLVLPIGLSRGPGRLVGLGCVASAHASVFTAWDGELWGRHDKVTRMELRQCSFREVLLSHRYLDESCGRLLVRGCRLLKWLSIRGQGSSVRASLGWLIPEDHKSG
jgi:hypothetical protein